MIQARYSADPTIIECGCDEVGRGCIAGPVYAAAVVFPADYYNAGINDSKQLTRSRREQLRTEIEAHAISWAVASIDEATIDKVNILHASFMGMNKAIAQLTVKPNLLLIDGNRFINETDILYHCIVKGDAKYLAIAAASILAKTYRDEYMEKLAEEFPQYGWAENKGYPTPSHQEAVLKYGRCQYHRKSFQLKGQLRLEF